jgi:hypothetical protein
MTSRASFASIFVNVIVIVVIIVVVIIVVIDWFFLNTFFGNRVLSLSISASFASIID